jgi:cytochrome c5
MASIPFFMSFSLQASSEIKNIEQIYNTNCSLCHSAYNPSDYTAKQWDVIAKRMFPKAVVVK